MSYVVINELFVDTENTQAFETNFSESMIGTLGSVQGLTRARLLSPERPDRGYLSILEFTDRRAYDHYLDSAAFQEAHNWPNHAQFSSNELAEFVPVTEL